MNAPALATPPSPCLARAPFARRCLAGLAGLFAALSGWAAAQADTTPPQVQVIFPNGGENIPAGTEQFIRWVATDDVAVTKVLVFYREFEDSPWVAVSPELANTGTLVWYPHNTPTSESRIRVEARDAAGNVGEDLSDATFTIVGLPPGVLNTTLRDFHLAGSQPFDILRFQSNNFCRLCHGDYDQSVEPYFTAGGSMMSHSLRDPMFKASLVIAEQDAPSSGDQCLRCHTPVGWMAGRCQPTDGSQLNPQDRQGVACAVCHQLVDPNYEEGVSPPEDVAILQALPLENIPTTYGEGQAVFDPSNVRWRGPFEDAEAGHTFLYSPFHRSSDLCGTCHDVSNPLVVRVSDRGYELAPLDQKTDSLSPEVLFPAERTYSEWKASAFNSPGGLYRPEFAGNRPDGMVSQCSDCHMRDVAGKGCNSELAPLRQDLPLHDLTGGNTFIPLMLPSLYGNEVDAAALAAGIDRARYMLQNSAEFDVALEAVADSFEAVVTVTNRTGHKLPTGYPEGRRMWIHLEARDVEGNVIYTSGRYDAETAELIPDPDARVYEIRLGLSQQFAQQIGKAAGPSYHIALSDSIYKDTRIPPEGFTNAAYAAFGGQPIDSSMPEPRYADGQNWDEARYPLPPETWAVYAYLYYQTTSKEHVEFLRDANTTDDQGEEFYSLWEQFGKSAPELMAADTVYLQPSEVGDPIADAGGARVRLRAGRNPALGAASIVLDLERPTELSVDVYDLGGRHRATLFTGTMAMGPHSVLWNGLDDSGRDAGSGIFFVRVAGKGFAPLTQRIVRLRAR